MMLLIKFVYMLRIQIKQNINILLENSESLIEYLNNVQDVYKNIDECNLGKIQEILIAFDMIADMISNKNLNPIVTELFIRGIKLNKCVLLLLHNHTLQYQKMFSTHCFFMKIPIKRVIQKIAINHLLDIDFKDYTFVQKYTAEPYLFLVIDTPLSSNNPLPVKCNLLERILKIILTIADNIRDKKLQDNINREAAKISALLSGKIDQYEYLSGEEILLFVPS